jgi:hypothetical protein
MISDSTLPTKSALIRILKQQLYVDYRQFKLEGLKNIKERIILLIFVYHKVLKDARTDREDVVKEIKQQAVNILGGDNADFDHEIPENLLMTLFQKIL